VTADDPKYWAFISYSHRDVKVARALQRALETYRLPGRLIGTTTAVGTIPEYVKPVFRDRDEMEAGADLKATVREALRQSRYLIVICSPDAARSAWVNQEIIEFKKLHGENRVLALIVAGEPFANNMAGREAEECFPEALRFALDTDGLPRGEALEPIAADLRPQGDGKRLAILKLIAGMVGVGVDSLVRRDAQRRARRLAYVASGAVAGMAVMAILTVMAVQSRIEAQKQRAQAEDLIEFMLGDLRKKLDPVGRLDVLDSVGEKALGYYAKQDTDKLDANALGRRSRALHLIGELREKQAKLDEALAAFTSASETTAELLAKFPNDPQRIFDHAQSVYWVGYIAWRKGNAVAAEHAFLKYRDLANRLVAIDASNPDWQLETAYASQNLGVVQLESWQLDEALKSFTTQKDIELRLVRKKPELAIELAEGYGWISKTLDASGKYPDAIDAQLERIKVLQSIADSATNKLVQQQIANAKYELGHFYLNLGESWAAEPYASAAVAATDNLVALDPGNLAWLAELSFERFNLAEIALNNGKHGLASAELERAIAQTDKLTSRDLSRMIWQVNLKGRELTLVSRFGPTSTSPSIIQFENYLRGVGRFEASGMRLDWFQLTIVATVELAFGDCLFNSKRNKEAEIHWNAAIARLQDLAEHGSYPAQTATARAQLRSGHVEEARTLAANLKNSKYRHPTYADLVGELAHVTEAGRAKTMIGRN
jgi:tetratricopeptide (TPR) repeat protein